MNVLDDAQRSEALAVVDQHTGAQTNKSSDERAAKEMSDRSQQQACAGVHASASVGRPPRMQNKLGTYDLVVATAKIIR